jgi:hypothetical protein
MAYKPSTNHPELLDLLRDQVNRYLQQRNADGTRRSKAQIARSLYIDRTTLYKWLDGTNRIPGQETTRLLKVLSVSVPDQSEQPLS